MQWGHYTSLNLEFFDGHLNLAILGNSENQSRAAGAA